MQTHHLTNSGQANILSYHIRGFRFTSRSIRNIFSCILAKHPILHVASLKTFPFLCFMLGSNFHPLKCLFSVIYIRVNDCHRLYAIPSFRSVYSVTFSLLAHQCMSVYTPHCLPIMLCHHLCIPMLVYLSFVVKKSVRSQHNHRRSHYMRVPSEYVCRVEFGTF